MKKNVINSIICIISIVLVMLLVVLLDGCSAGNRQYKVAECQSPGNVPGKHVIKFGIIRLGDSASLTIVFEQGFQPYRVKRKL